MLKLLKIAMSIIFISAVIILCFTWFRKYDLFRINGAKVVGNKLITELEILELANIDFSKEVFNLNVEAIEKRILLHPIIENVSITRYLPSTIKIEIEEKDLIAVVPGLKLNVLDAEATIINIDKITTLYDLPIMTGAIFRTDSLDRKIVSPMMKKMVMILKALRNIDYQFYHDLSEIRYTKESGMAFYLRSNGLPIILGYYEYPRKINYVATIYNLLKKRDELSELKWIDVRFAGQVVVKK